MPSQRLGVLRGSFPYLIVSIPYYQSSPIHIPLINQSMLKQILLLSAIILLTTPRTPKGLVNTAPPVQKGSHFFSETQKVKEFPLNDLDPSETLVIILKGQEDYQEIDFQLENPLKFEVQYRGKVIKTCNMTAMNSLCVVPKIQNKLNNSVKVTCSQLPCEFALETLQFPPPSLASELKDDSLRYLYKIDANESLIKVKSNDPAIEDLASEVRVYANAPYELINKDGNLVYYDFYEYIDYVLINPSINTEKSVRVQVSLFPDNIQYNETYRFTVNKTKEIKVPKIPSKELRVDMTLSEVNNLRLSKTTITFLGYKSSSDSDPVEIETFHIDEMDEEGLLDLNLILKKNAFTSFKHFSMEINTPQVLIMSFRLVDSSVHQLEVEQESYISLDKDQTVEYKIVASPNSDASDVVDVQLLDQEQRDKVDIKLNPDPCFYSQGCTMKVTAKDPVIMGLGVVLKRELNNDMKYIPLKKSVELLLAEGERLYLMHNETGVKSKKISVNSGNVIVYAAGINCPEPSRKCNEYVGSLQKPILIQNPTYPLYLSVEGLELVRFTIRVDEVDSVVDLEDGVALTQSITGKQRVYLRFKIKEKEEVNFNLIAPLNTFKMYVGNSNQKPDVDDINLEISSNYIKFERNEIDELVFTILIKKVDNSSQQTFTIIASTSNAIIVLGKGEPHYDVISEGESKTYVVLVHEDDIKDDIENHISFSLFQVVDSVNFTYQVGIDLEGLGNQTKIVRRHDLIDIEDYAEQHCNFNETDICDLFFKLTSHNPERLDITLTLVTNNTLIELKPGIWQSFQMASLTASSHFYFIPTNKKYPINLQFTHTFGTFKISYLLWKNEDSIHDPGLWPFPTESSAVDVKAAFQASDYTIHTEQITKCFPNCVLLVSLVDTDNTSQKQEDPNTVTPIFSRFGSYSIMASNVMMELRELEKSSITLVKNESKYVMIDLTPYMKDDTSVITIYTSSMVGFTTVIGKLSSNRNPDFPSDSDNDYRVIGPELQIKMEDIKGKLEKNGMEEHEEISLVLMLKAVLHSRIIISFTSKENYIEHLLINVPQDVTIQPHGAKFYSLEYFQDYKIKIVRTSGFPNVAYDTCSTKNLERCIEDLEKNSGSVMNSKVDQISIKHKQATMTIIKLTTGQDAAQLQLTAVGNNAATELKEGQTVNDFLQKKEVNRYKVSVTKETETIITVTVFEGNPTVVVKNDLEGIKITGKKKGNLVQIHVPSSAFKKALDNPSQPSVVISNTALSIVFSELIIEVTDNDFNCAYSISYTLGQRNLYIQDGILTSGTLRPNEEITYSYHNSKNSTAFVAISFDNAQSMERCEIEYASYSDDEEPVLKAPAHLEMKPRTPRPSITFHLEENYTDFEIRLKSNDSKDLSFNITINHVDIVLLPYGYKYPNYLGKNESSYFVIEVHNEGYIEFDLRKCTDNPLTFSYALDDESFQSEQYTFTGEIQDHRFTSFVHVKASTIFLRVQTEEPSLFSIQANWFREKKAIPNNKIKAGNNGLMEYIISGEKTATVSYSPLNCEDCHANNITYEYLIGKNKADVMSQTACEGQFFLFAPIQIIPSQVVKSKPSNIESGKFVFDVKLPDQLSYIGLKAKLSDGREVFYGVLEVSTIWGSIQKNKNYHLGLLTFIGIILAFCCYMYKKRPRPNVKGPRGAPYQDLPQEFDP